MNEEIKIEEIELHKTIKIVLRKEKKCGRHKLKKNILDKNYKYCQINNVFIRVALYKKDLLKDKKTLQKKNIYIKLLFK